jgi:hypothetical protein
MRISDTIIMCCVYVAFLYCQCTWRLFLVNKVSSNSIENNACVSQEKQFFLPHMIFHARLSCAITRMHNKSKKPLVTRFGYQIAEWNYMCVIEKKRAQLIGHWRDDQPACKNSLPVEGKNCSLSCCRLAEKRRLCVGGGQQNSRCADHERRACSRTPAAFKSRVVFAPAVVRARLFAHMIDEDFLGCFCYLSLALTKIAISKRKYP